MKETIRIAGVIRESIVDGPGLRFAVFTQGCAHRCKSCQNPDTWDFGGGYDCEISKILSAIDQNPLLDGLTLTGGDPIYQPEACYELAREVKKRNLTVLIFTGFTYEELMEMASKDQWLKKLLDLTDILIDGKYEEDKRDLTLQFRGSSNQKIINMKLSREQGKPVLDQRYM